ncbi:MAG: cytochrome c [Acidimicrobiales bacterium]|nr:cytochrome c [Acidimicrobiales bacterium]
MKRFVDGIEAIAFVVAGVFVLMLFFDKPTTDLAIAAPVGSSADGTNETSDAGPDLTLGAQVFADRCAMCHGASGGGGSGPALAGRVVEAYPDPADQLAVVRDGRRSMPAFGGRLTTAELDAVVAYTREGLG